LHLAAYEGAAEVVKLLLLKGVPIDQLNNENRNCLDIAISRGQREVIRVLLNDENWAKLIRFNDRDKVEDADEYLLTVVAQNSTQDNDSSQLGFESAKKEDKIKKAVENPQLVALYDAKMWDIFKLLLDKCVTYKEVDFTKIDPPVKSISAHTLMLIARSGQEVT
jgi:ankyrin repeat protein